MTLNLPLVPGLDVALKNGEHKLILVTDHVASPADFILHRVLAQSLKSSPPVHTTVISLEREFAQWSAIAAKNNIQLSRHLKDGNLTYIDGLSVSSSSSSPQKFDIPEGYHVVPSVFQNVDSHTITLRGLYSILERVLQQRQVQSSHVLILDSPCILDFIGVPSLEITRFIRAVAGLYRSNTPSSLILVRDHITSSHLESSTPFDTPVLRLLVSLSYAHIEVRSLKTGRSGAVSGEVCLHPGGVGDLVKGQGGRAAAIQYRLMDSGAVFFQRGMSKGVL